MKLAVTFLAALVESKPYASKRKKELAPGSDNKDPIGLYHNVPALECSSEIITENSVNADGVSGSIVMKKHGNNEHCFVDIGPQCSYGVDVEIVSMDLENAMGYYYTDTDGAYTYYYDDGTTYTYQYDYCYDALFFAHKQNGEQKKTDQQCGIHNDNNPYYYDTLKPTSYWLNGDEAKVVFYSDESVKGNGFHVDWKCHEDWDICPSNTCYTQSEGWTPGKEVSCEMTNSDCLNVSCSSGSIKANFSADLFHTNLENEGSFMDQLESGHREMWYNGNKLDLNAPCGFTLTPDGVQIDWSYELCNVTPTMNANDQIVYSVSLSSPGNAPGYQTIEFYVDSGIEASCVYDNKVTVNADGFWVNQEDVAAAGDAMGKFRDIFDCKFYADEALKNQILSNNIVNMGEMIYGQVTSKTLAGLSYELVGVTVSNANNLDMSFPVINDGVPNSDLKATSEGSALTGQSVAFSYLSFGFESETGTNQNELEIECAVDLFISACEVGFHQVGNNCFKFNSEVNEKLVHKQACKKLGANLAAPKNAAEQQELLDFLANQSADSSTSVWLGWNDGQNDGTYVLDNSKGAVLMPWDNFRAEDNLNTVEKGSIVMEYQTGDWIRTDAFGNYAAVCSKSLN